jgi:hypothetical protein
MILLIPLSRFRVTYEAGRGRPYSKLESLILKAVEQGAGTLDDLHSMFGIHRRLLIEALVTLTQQAGWLAVSSVPGKSFLITSDGRQALASGDTPSSLLILPGETYVLKERLTGELLWYRDVRYVSERELEDLKVQCVRLPPHVSDQQVDGARVQHLLPRAQGEWIRWIGPIDLVGREHQWLPVTVDLRGRNISGLPDAWRHLRDTLLEEADRRASALPTGTSAAVWSRQPPARPEQEDPRSALPPWTVTLTPQDFLYDAVVHDAFLREVLLKGATSSVFIASAFVTRSRLEAIRIEVAEALRRGVSIDLLWGYGAEREALNWLTNQATEAKREAWPGRVRFNRNASGSHAKLLLWDRSPNQFEACLGSCNWLSFSPEATGAPKAAEVSVRLLRPGLVAQLNRCAASLWEGAKDVLSAVPNGWQRAAAEMERLEATDSPRESANASVTLIFDHEHERALREWLRTAQQRLLVASHRLGPVAATRLLAAERRTRTAGFHYAVVYGHTELDAAQLGQVGQTVGNAGGSLLYAPQQHAKVIVCDDTACVSSYNFLSADPFQTASRARELGVVIEGSEPVAWLAQRLSGNIEGELEATAQVSLD